MNNTNNKRASLTNLLGSAVLTALVVVLLQTIFPSCHPPPTHFRGNDEPNVRVAGKEQCPTCPACPKATSLRSDIPAAVPPRTWYQVAATTKTDKITTHAYDFIYDKYLPQFFAKGKIKLLEIGLGCNMDYGPGESLKVWVEYFKTIDLELHFMEYNADCARQWQPKFPHIKFHIGDQANTADLQTLLDASGGGFDVIVDDGGHTMKQQIVSLEFLLPRALKPGGVYIVEDLISSTYDPFYNGYSFVSFVAKLQEEMHFSEKDKDRDNPNRPPKLYEQLLSVDASRGIVALTKMPIESEKPPGMRLNKNK